MCFWCSCKYNGVSRRMSVAALHGRCTENKDRSTWCCFYSGNLQRQCFTFSLHFQNQRQVHSITTGYSIVINNQRGYFTKFYIYYINSKARTVILIYLYILLPLWHRYLATYAFIILDQAYGYFSVRPSDYVRAWFYFVEHTIIRIR